MAESPHVSLSHTLHCCRIAYNRTAPEHNRRSGLLGRSRRLLLPTGLLRRGLLLLLLRLEDRGRARDGVLCE